MKIGLWETYLATFTAKLFKAPLTEKVSWDLFFKFPFMVIFYKILWIFGFVFIQPIYKILSILGIFVIQILQVIWFWVVIFAIIFLLSLII
jgi:hypothetical protein